MRKIHGFGRWAVCWLILVLLPLSAVQAGNYWQNMGRGGYGGTLSRSTSQTGFSSPNFKRNSSLNGSPNLQLPSHMNMPQMKARKLRPSERKTVTGMPAAGYGYGAPRTVILP